MVHPDSSAGRRGATGTSADPRRFAGMKYGTMHATLPGVRGALRAWSFDHQPSEPDPARTGEGTATSDGAWNPFARRRLLAVPAFFYARLNGSTHPKTNLSPPPAVPHVMTIAGSDSGAGAGIQADLKTFAAHGVYGATVITAVTAQNTRQVFAIAEVPEEVVAIQIDGVMEDIGAEAVKIGMLSGASIIEVVADRLEAWGVERLVVDPVMVAKSGDRLLQNDAVQTLTARLLPLALIVTPNLPEAEVLAGMVIQTEEHAREAARIIASRGPRFVVVKGGHRRDEPIDIVFDGSTFTELPARRIDTPNTHGTGCTFASAIAANLAWGHHPLEAIAAAKSYLIAALEQSYRVGAGHSPVNHFPDVTFPAARRLVTLEEPRRA